MLGACRARCLKHVPLSHPQACASSTSTILREETPTPHCAGSLPLIRQAAMSSRRKPRSIRLTVEDQTEAAVLIAVLETALDSADHLRAREALSRWVGQTRSSPQAAALAQGNVFDIATGSAHETSDPVQRIFDHWRAIMHKPRARLDAKRRRLVRRRLDEGYTEAELIAAIDGCSRSAWHQGANDDGRKYNDLSLIFRDAGHLEQFQELSARPVRAPASRRSSFSAAGRDAQTTAELERFKREGK
jgi:hypothetical protein